MRRLLSILLLSIVLLTSAATVLAQHKDGHEKGPKQENSQGNSPSRPDQDGIGADKGVDNDDKQEDGNNGCGNDSDREDDNNGNCGRKETPAPRPTSTPTPRTSATPSAPSPGEGGSPTPSSGPSDGEPPSATPPPGLGPTPSGEESPGANPSPEAGRGLLPFTGSSIILWLYGGILAALAGYLVINRVPPPKQ